jgi:hypothetical protein
VKVGGRNSALTVRPNSRKSDEIGELSSGTFQPEHSAYDQIRRIVICGLRSWCIETALSTQASLHKARDVSRWHVKAVKS